MISSKCYMYNVLVYKDHFFVFVGVIARHPDILPYLRQALTTEAVESYFSHLFENKSAPSHHKIQRYLKTACVSFNIKKLLGTCIYRCAMNAITPVQCI